MKSILITPDERGGVPLLAENAPLANVVICGKPLIAYWLEYLAKAGAKEVLVLATDRPQEIRSVLGDGSRWGLKIQVLPESRELTPEEARLKYHVDGEQWLADGHDVVVADELPGIPEKLFSSYSTFINLAHRWMPHAAATCRIGLREMRPGVWVGLHTRIAPGATLNAPCWIGDNVSIGGEAVIGPMAIVEDRVMVESAAEVAGSQVAPDTLVGSFTRVRNSLALGNLLIDWGNNSSLRVPDAFLLCSLRDHRLQWNAVAWPARAAALAAMIATLPIAILPMLLSWMQGQRPLRARRGVLPPGSTAADSVVYYELTSGAELWRRWPQLWNVWRGEFAWVGNRPLHSFEAGKLVNDFERLWLATPIGLISQADAEGCFERFSDEARAHASFYAVQATLPLRLSILRRGGFRLLAGSLGWLRGGEAAETKGKAIPFGSPLTR